MSVSSAGDTPQQLAMCSKTAQSLGTLLSLGLVALESWNQQGPVRREDQVVRVCVLCSSNMSACWYSCDKAAVGIAQLLQNQLISIAWGLFQQTLHSFSFLVETVCHVKNCSSHIVSIGSSTTSKEACGRKLSLFLPEEEEGGCFINGVEWKRNPNLRGNAGVIREGEFCILHTDANLHLALSCSLSRAIHFQLYQPFPPII